MIRIESAYGPDIIRSAKRYSPTGTDPQDMYQEIILAVYHRVRRRKVSLRNRNAMLNTIKQRAIDQSRKALLHRQRFTHVPEVSETARYSDGLIQTPERMRVKELKARIRLSLPQLDARIVIELAFPSSGTRNLARHRPTREGPTRRKVNSRTTPTVRKWHVAKFFRVSDARVTQATRMAEKVVGYVIEQEGRMERGKGGASDKRLCR